MRHTISLPRRRGGFTLVELLVASALTMLIMTILASAFQTALDSLSQLRSAGELQDRLRSASERLKQDLQAPHFEDEAVALGKLSNVRFDLNASAAPRAGFFRMEQDSPASPEASATDPRSYSSRATNERLLFTVKLPGNSRQTTLTAPRRSGDNLDTQLDNFISDTTNSYGSRWGIVSWFLAPSPDRTTGPAPVQLYTLHRRVRLLSEIQGSTVNNPVSNQNPHYSCNGTGPLAVVNTPRDVSSGRTLATLLDTPLGDGSDIVLANVLSFEVKASYEGAGVLIGTFPRVAQTGTNNFDFPYDDLPPKSSLAADLIGYRVFDTGFAGGTGLSQQYRVKSLQIKLRVYDPKTKNTRQVTIVQDM